MNDTMISYLTAICALLTGLLGLTKAVVEMIAARKRSSGTRFLKREKCDLVVSRRLYT